MRRVRSRSWLPSFPFLFFSFLSFHPLPGLGLPSFIFTRETQGWPSPPLPVLRSHPSLQHSSSRYRAPVLRLHCSLTSYQQHHRLCSILLHSSHSHIALTRKSSSHDPNCIALTHLLRRPADRHALCSERSLDQVHLVCRTCSFCSPAIIWASQH